MVAKVQLNPPPTNIMQHVQVGAEQVEFPLPYQLLIWLNSIFNRVGSGPFLVQGYTVAALPDATESGSVGTEPFSSIIFVSDESGGPTLAFSDGTNWLRMSDNAIVS